MGRTLEGRARCAQALTLHCSCSWAGRATYNHCFLWSSSAASWGAASGPLLLRHTPLAFRGQRHAQGSMAGSAQPRLYAHLHIVGCPGIKGGCRGTAADLVWQVLLRERPLWGVVVPAKHVVTLAPVGGACGHAVQVRACCACLWQWAAKAPPLHSSSPLACCRMHTLPWEEGDSVPLPPHPHPTHADTHTNAHIRRHTLAARRGSIVCLRQHSYCALPVRSC